jgi:cell wall-associated NlpC family hydrolase
VLTSLAALASFALPGAIGSAEAAGSPPSLQATVAAANRLSDRIDFFGQQYDALRSQLSEARAEVKIARETVLRDKQALGAGEAAVARIAAGGYMAGSIDPTVQLLQGDNPQEMLNKVSIMIQLGHEQGGTLSLLQSAEAAANRASKTAAQEAARANALSAQLSKKVAEIQAEENVLNSSAYAQALAIYNKTGTYPAVALQGNSAGVQAVRWALTQVGKPYVWGGAGPDGYDCSGLVMKAYEQVGISLGHYTGSQWNEGEHVSRDQLQPGDILFFFQNLDHEGLYIGNDLMIDAPTFGVPVHVERPFWYAFDGAVRVV